MKAKTKKIILVTSICIILLLLIAFIYTFAKSFHKAETKREDYIGVYYYDLVMRQDHLPDYIVLYQDSTYTHHASDGHYARRRRLLPLGQRKSPANGHHTPKRHLGHGHTRRQFFYTPVRQLNVLRKPRILFSQNHHVRPRRKIVRLIMHYLNPITFAGCIRPIARLGRVIMIVINTNVPKSTTAKCQKFNVHGTWST